MPGIYIHIPYCKQACHYCDFHFSTSQKSKNDFVNELLKEVILQKDYFKNLGQEPANSHVISTIYFGGGTPSLLETDDIQRIIEEVKRIFIVSDSAEITLEANPDDLSEKKFLEFRNAGINRLSIGIQSFADEDLKFMNRSHNSKEAIECVRRAQEIGFSNISIDLIYGTPTLTHGQWKKNLQIAFELNVPHLSCYSLTVEPRTALAKFIQSGKVPDISDQHSAEQFEMLMNLARENNFEQYEISNFAKDKMHSRHNSSYWKGDWYLGLGPSAHSFNGSSRQWNISNNQLYIRSIAKGKIPFEKEELTRENKFNEYILTSLRTMWGCDLEKIRNDFGVVVADKFFSQVSKYVNENVVESKEQNFVLTQKGKFFADKIASELFLIND